MPERLHARDLLRRRPVWAIPLVVGCLMIAVMTVLYVGSTVDPTAHLHGLPVSVVNEDAGARVDGRTENVGASVQSALLSTPAVTSKLAVQASTLAAAEAKMDRGASFATVRIPSDLTVSLLALDRQASRTSGGLPKTLILTNLRAGSEGANLASGVLQPALEQISGSVGRRIEPLVSAGGPPNAATAAVLADPLSIEVTPYRRLPDNAALGLSAFYASLLILMCGFVGAVIVNTALDGFLGYAPTEVGPRWGQRRPVLISRWQTLLAKWAMAIVLTAVLAALMLLIAALLLGLDAPDPLLLWLYGWLCASAVAIGTLSLIAVLGSLGQLVALLLFVYLGLASAGGTVPIQALPDALRLVSHADPLRQILGGVRAILYFESRADAGLAEGAIAAAIGMAFWVAFGAFFVIRYDRKGRHRMDPELLDYVNRAADAYAAPSSAPPGAGLGS